MVRYVPRVLLIAIAVAPIACVLVGCGNKEEKPDLKPGEIYAPRPNNNEKSKNAPPRVGRGQRGDG